MQWREVSKEVTVFKRFLRWPFFLLFAALLLAALIPILRTGYNGIAHAVSNNPQITVAASVAKGQPFQLQVQGFRAAEEIQLSWNGNGGQFLGMLTADATGAAKNCANSASCIVSPPVPAGTYTLTAIGSTSGLQVNTSISVTSNLAVTPQYVGPGSTVQVVGSGFQARENLTIYFQLPTNGAIPTTADGTGSFTQSLRLPNTYTPQTSYFVYVANVQHVIRAKASFSFAALSLTSSVAKAFGGGSITINGKGFLAHEVISLHWDFQRLKPVMLGTISADANGNFTQTIIAPTLFTTYHGILVATGASSNLQATTDITLLGSMINPGPIKPITNLNPRPTGRRH
jgi:hypothetical protein